jgi:MFS superfamily sulfate permease-like transporter
MLLIILWIGPIFKTLPRSVLSCIVIVNLRGMFLQFYELPNLWKVSKIDFIIWLASFCGVLVFGVDLENGLKINGCLENIFKTFLRKIKPKFCL